MSKNDAVIKEMIAKIKEKKEQLGTKPRGILETNGVFENENGKVLNVNTINELYVLVSCLATILAREDYLKKASDVLGVKNTGFDYCGYSVDQWKRDFTLRKDIIEWNAKSKELSKLEEKLKTLRSEEARTEEELEEIGKILQ
jgi:hypothetical protein